MAIEYLGLSEINGPLVVLEGVKNASYEEIVEFHMDDGTRKIGRIIEIYEDKAVIQVFEGTPALKWWDITTELFYHEIPVFTMQPIVENAILHGVKGVTAGQIIVSAIEYENDFVISVFNNGNSADKKKIEDLLKGEKNQRAVTGIGLYNVNSRLKLLYGESYGLIYNEKVRNGFEIWVRLPKKITESEER